MATKMNMKAKSAVNRFSWARLLCGAFSAAIFIHTLLGIIQGRLNYKIGSNGSMALVELTTPQGIAAGSLCWGIVATLLFIIAAKPSFFRNAPILIISVLALVGAIAGLDYLA